MKPSQFNFFRRFLNSFAENQFVVLNKIDSVTCQRLQSWTSGHEAAHYAARLFVDRAVEVREFGLRLQLKTLRELDGAEFNHIEILSRQDRRRRTRTCFVGHRFSAAVEKTLRWNLRQILEPYKIKLEWSGRDMSSVQILEDIVKKIKEADFCVFDNRATKGKPNVYIEAGMCVVLKKPFVLFEYTSTPKHPEDPGPIPSDLNFALALRYRNY
jgi:hypothetical protein